jgi:hypothetical protein
MNSQKRQSILLEKHAHSLTKKLYDVTLGNLLGYNKKFFYRTTLTYQQSVKVKQAVSLHQVESRNLCFTACSQAHSPN